MWEKLGSEPRCGGRGWSCPRDVMSSVGFPKSLCLNIKSLKRTKNNHKTNKSNFQQPRTDTHKARVRLLLQIPAGKRGSEALRHNRVGMVTLVFPRDRHFH